MQAIASSKLECNSFWPHACTRGRMWVVCHAEVMDYNYDGQQGKCTRPGAVGGNLVDMLVEQAAAQWDMQHHPGWTIHHDAACSAMPVGQLGSRVQLL